MEVVTPTTAVPLANTSVLVPYFVVQALPGNVGQVYVGDAGVQSDFGLELQPGQILKISADDTLADEDNILVDIAQFYVDADNAGDKVNILALVLDSVNYNS